MLGASVEMMEEVQKTRDHRKSIIRNGWKQSRYNAALIPECKKNWIHVRRVNLIFLIHVQVRCLWS